MNITQSVKKVTSQLTGRKKIIAIAGLISCLLVGATGYAYQQQLATSRSVKEAASSKVETKTTPTEKEPVIADTSSTTKVEEPAAKTPDTTAPAQSTPQKQQKPAPQQVAPSYPPPSVSPSISASRIETTYTYCVSGTLHYSLSNVHLSTAKAAAQTFSWKVEHSNGSTVVSGTNTMPSDKTYWASFPSTPTYPAPLGTIAGAHDGDRARFVITSPNYFAGGWSDAVPAGSEELCRTGQM